MSAYLSIGFVLPEDSVPEGPPMTDLEERLAADLWEAGTLGLEIHPADAGPDRRAVRLTAWFPAGFAMDRRLEELCRAWEPRGVRCTGEELVAEADWLAAWRERSRPLRVGRFLLDPREPKQGAEPGEALEAGEAGVAGAPEQPAAADLPTDLPTDPRPIVLRLPARTAFGTGSHESTRLALRLLEGWWRERRSRSPGPASGKMPWILDVGTGTGVLSLALLGLAAVAGPVAAPYGAPAGRPEGLRVIAYDVDPEALPHARSNARLSGLGTALEAPSPAAPILRLFAGTAAALRPPSRPLAGRPATPGFELILANVLPERISADLASLADLLVPGGEMVLSGLLSEQVEESRNRMALAGLAPVSEARENEWAALRLRRQGGAP